MSKAVYFLGAGATIAVAPNAPVNINLLEKALQDFPETMEAKSIENFVKDIFKNRPNPPRDNQIWNLLDYIIQEGKSPSRGYNIERITELKSCLLNLIINEVEEGVKDADVETYRKFVMAIKNNVGSAIISTNYDILIDNALAQLNCFNYGPKIRHAVYISSSERAIPSEQLIGNGNVLLLKIHGSLNWLYCPKCDEVDLAKQKKGALATLTGLYCNNSNCTSQYTSLLITPTMFKNYKNRFIKEVWRYAEKVLTEADELIFIGYALKEEDYQIRCLLMKALLNKECCYKKVTVVEDEKLDEKKAVDIEAKYQQLYGDDIDVRTIGFVEYINQLTSSN